MVVVVAVVVVVVVFMVVDDGIEMRSGICWIDVLFVDESIRSREDQVAIVQVVVDRRRHALPIDIYFGALPENCVGGQFPPSALSQSSIQGNCRK